MPNKAVESLRVSGTKHDKRVKLSMAEKLDIIALHTSGISIHQLSRDFQVSRRTIQFIIFPERKELNLEHREERGGSIQYYTKEKQRVYMKTHRDHKATVLAEKR